MYLGRVVIALVILSIIVLNILMSSANRNVLDLVSHSCIVQIVKVL